MFLNFSKKLEKKMSSLIIKILGALLKLIINFFFLNIPSEKYDSVSL